MINLLDKNGDELIGQDISEVLVKNDGDIWVVKHRNSKFVEVVELEWLMEDWSVSQMGVEGLTPASNFSFLYSVHLPILVES